MIGVMSFRKKKDKLIPRFVGLLEILRWIGEVTYELVLPLSLLIVHSIFYVSMVGKYVLDESCVILLDSIELGPELSFEEESIIILDTRVWKLRMKKIAPVKVI